MEGVAEEIPGRMPGRFIGGITPIFFFMIFCGISHEISLGTPTSFSMPFFARFFREIKYKYLLKLI